MMQDEDLIIENLKSTKPQVQPDDAFKMSLFQNLQSEMKKKANQSKFNNINFNFMQKFKFVIPAAALALVALIVVVSYPNYSNPQNVLLSSDQQILKVSDNAFGRLTALSSAAGDRRQGGGGNAQEADKMAVPSSLTIDPGYGGGGTGIGFPIYPTYYKYVYKGAEFSVDADKMEVYERQKGFGFGVDVQSFLDRFDVSMLNIEKFTNAEISYISAQENRDFGYILSMDLKEGSIYIGENWEKWQPIDYSQPIRMDQVPSDEQAIEMANQFLDQYGISRENFGTPFVQNIWRIMYAESSDKSSIYIPDIVSVVYPTKIAGNEIYDLSGTKTGMYVSINLRSNRVSSVGEITSQRYNSSEYETEKDIARIKKIAENSGYQGYMPFIDDENIQVKEIELGTPTKAYVRMWQTLDGRSRDMYIPSLIFPITNQLNDYYQQSVIVPLIKQVLDSQQDIPYPMPLPVERM